MRWYEVDIELADGRRIATTMDRLPSEIIEMIVTQDGRYEYAICEPGLCIDTVLEQARIELTAREMEGRL